jgi:hypothetical protein
MSSTLTRSEAFTAAEVHKILSCYQMYHLTKSLKRFTDHLCPLHQDRITSNPDDGYTA